jgi:hypothetical protein
MPAVHAVQTCEAEQTWPAAQFPAAPAETQDWSVQTGVPVPQAMVALVAQGLVDVQIAPAVHDVQVPSRHTRFVPQDIPLAIGVAVATQVGVPEVQEIAPTRHGVADGVQVCPELQGRHRGTRSAEQTEPVAHGVPGDSGRPVGVHTGPPVSQVITPGPRQGFEGVQEAPAEQAVQAPAAEHTPPGQTVPTAWRA